MCILIQTSVKQGKKKPLQGSNKEYHRMLTAGVGELEKIKHLNFGCEKQRVDFHRSPIFAKVESVCHYFYSPPPAACLSQLQRLICEMRF